MIAHIAQADEQRGRVVLWLNGAGEPQDTAVDAALCLAQAFQSEVESLFVEDRQLYDCAALPFAREISLSGRKSRALAPDALSAELKILASALQRNVLARARAAQIKTEVRSVRGDPVQALAEACAANGPWNVVTLGAGLRREGGPLLAELFDTIEATTGIVVAGRNARRTAGPVVAIVEELERAVPMMRAAERIASASGGEVRLWLVEHDQEQLAWMEGQIRLALGATPGISLEAVDLSTASPWSVAHRMRRAGAGFVIARFGGQLLAREDDAVALAEILDGPLFLVR